MKSKAQRVANAGERTESSGRLNELRNLGPLTKREFDELRMIALFERKPEGTPGHPNPLVDPETWAPHPIPPSTAAELVVALARITKFLPAEPPRTGTWGDQFADFALYHQRTHLGLVQTLSRAVKAGDIEAALSSMWQLTWGIAKTHASVASERAAKKAWNERVLDRRRKLGHDGKESRDPEWFEARDDQLVKKYRKIRSLYRSDTAATREVAASFQGISFDTVKRALKRRTPT